MSGNHHVIVSFHSRRLTLPREGRYRRLTMEQLEYRWLLSGTVSATDWPAAAVAVDYATTRPTETPTAAPASNDATAWSTAAPPVDNAAAWPTNAATAVSAAPSSSAAPNAASVPTTQVAESAAAGTTTSPAAGTAASVPAAASSADCDSQSGWVDVGPSGSGNSGSDSGYQNNPSSSWGSSGADQLPAKKPVQLQLSPDILSGKVTEGGLVDLTPISNSPALALLAAAPPDAGDANLGGEAALRSLSDAPGALPAVKLDGLRGTSQAFDVAVSPAMSRGDGPAPEDTRADLKFHPATVWPMPNLPRLRSDSGGVPSASILPESAPPSGEGKTTFAPAQGPSANSVGAIAPSSNARLVGGALPSTQMTASDADAKTRSGKAHDRVLSHVADFLRDLSAAARLNDRRLQAAVVAVALAALPYRQFRKRQDSDV